MPPIEPTRFAEGRAMLLAGSRRQHTFAGAATTIPAQWEGFRALGTLPGQRDALAYGVVCAAAPAAGTFEYMCGAEVESFDALPAGLGRMRVPAHRYAVFTHRGHVASLRTTLDAILQGWLPRSGHRLADTPDFQLYDPERFDAASGAGEIEIWFPIAEQGEAVWSPDGRGGPG